MVTKQENVIGWNLPLPRTRWMIVGFIAGVFTWSFAGGGRQRRVDDSENNVDAKAAGTVSRIDSTVQQVNQSIQDATSNVRHRISDVQNSAHHHELIARVKDRLSRETSIDDDRIEVAIKDDGTVVLNGQVPDKNDKDGAVEVARATDGVTRVEDRLSVPPAARVFAVKTDLEPSTDQSRRKR